MILVTGGSGYFGCLLVQKLLQNGKQCRVFDLVDVDDRPEEVEFYKGDIRDYQAILKACEGVSIVYHNVAQVPLAKDKNLFESVNILGTENLLKACIEKNVGKVVHTSSSAVFGVPKNNPVNENTIPEPGENYGRAKFKAENLCQKYISKGLDVTVIRPRTIMGHGRLGIFQILFEWIHKGSNVPVFGKGDNTYQFVHADDLAEACLLAAEKKSSEIYNIGTDRYGTMRGVLNALTEHAGTGSKVKSVPMTPTIWGMKVTSALGMSPLGAYHALMYGRSMYFDTTKAQTELKWQAKYSNEEMFIESYEWYLHHRDDVLSRSNRSHHRSAVNQGVLSLFNKIL